MQVDKALQLDPEVLNPLEGVERFLVGNYFLDFSAEVEYMVLVFVDDLLELVEYNVG